MSIVARRALVALLLALASGASADSRSDNLTSPLGTNLAPFASWGSDWVVVDAFAKSRAWTAGGCDGTWDTGRPLTLDAEGWVVDAPDGVCPRTLLMDGADYPTGTYVVAWEGEGRLDARYAATNFIPTGPGRATFQVVGPTAGRGVALEIRDFDRRRPIKNIQVILPGGVCGNSPTRLDPLRGCATPRGGTGVCAAGETCFDFESVAWNRFRDPPSAMSGSQQVVFHPDFLAKLRRYRVVRFMQWMRMNEGNDLAEWHDRTRVTAQDQTSGRGIAYEYTVALANLLGADAWINVPHRATDAFVDAMAAFYRAGLSRRSKLYVEYSNEAWNDEPPFPQSAYMKEQEGCVRDAAGGPWRQCPEGGARFFARRGRAILDRFTRVFGDDAARLVRVMGSRLADPGWSRRLLHHLGPNQGADRRVDALAVAPYFGTAIRWSEVAGFAPSRRLAAIFAALRDDLKTLRVPLAAQAMLAREHGLALVAYEGGQHLAPTSTAAEQAPAADAFAAANRDPRMRDLYARALADWQTVGGQLYVHYLHMSESGAYGAFGELEHPQQATSPKFEALIRFMDTHPCWWPGCAGLPPDGE